MKVQQVIMGIKPPKQELDPETFTADMSDPSFVLPVHGLHNQAYQTRGLIAQFLQIDFHGIVRTVHRFTVMDEIAHLHVQQERFIHIPDIERVKISIFSDHAHVRLIPEMLFSSFHTDHVLRRIRLSGYQIGGPQVHILDRGRKYDMYRFIISDFQPVRGYHPAKADLAAQSLKKIPATQLRTGSRHTRHQGKKHHQNLFHIRLHLDWLVND